MNTAVLETRIEGITNACIVAPCAPGGSVKTRVGNATYEMQVEQADFEGWGLFQPRTSKTARLVGRASQAAIEIYLNRLPRWEMRLVRKLRGKTWLAYARQIKGEGPCPFEEWFNPADGPMTVHLVEGGRPFAVCQARFDGRNMWFERMDPNADERQAELMLRALERGALPGKLRIAGISQLDRSAYSLEFLYRNPESEGAREERVVRLARLRGLSFFAQRWLIQWIDDKGELQTVTILERDLASVSSGICMAGEQLDLSTAIYE